ncbi:MAG: alpha/beta hydrolase [Salinivirgaceae bacterium]|nr:alpha/beta hydrolase [Salinivirgaceae bacterium]MDD2563548.1 alpha/beta hydrolase [Salinivirgaceae bacterium]
MKFFLTAIIVMLLFYSTYSIKPDSVIHITPNNFGLHYSKRVVLTKDSVELSGWFIPAQKKVNRDSVFNFYMDNPIVNCMTTQTEKKPTIIVCVGDGGNKSYSIWVANEFLVHDVNVFMFDWRGFGDSQKWPIKQEYLVVTEFLKDYDAIVDYVFNMPETDNTKIFAYGFSTGFYLTFATAVNNLKLRAIAGRSLITTLPDLKDCLATVKDTTGMIIPYDYPEDLYPLNCATKLTIPILMYVGRNDSRTPVWMSQKVFDKIKTPKKRLIIVDDSEHCDIETKLIDSIFKDIGDFFLSQ